MGVMIDGVYHSVDPKPDTALSGEYKRAAATIRGWITEDGPFPPQPGRYHLYVAWNCPWAHRALLTRAFLALDDLISVSYAAPRRTDQGWIYEERGPFSDPVLGVSALHEVYARQTPGYTGRATVPVLWDRQTETVVSNESADIIRMMRAFGRGPDLYPEALRGDIDAWNELIYPNVNNGVYRAGFARTQDAYEAGARDVFAALDKIEDQLSRTEYLTGPEITEADLRLFPTLARFDVAYHNAFRCNIRRLMDYPALWLYARRIFAMPGVAGTVDFDIYKRGYFSPSEARNPLGIIPVGPLIDWTLPAD
ncbi:MAG: glutathione-dependent reductase [Rhodobacteraceae bacterium]|nr:MAG: glutathione-dependent reductase [Paracoccaceae bacterium]